MYRGLCMFKTKIISLFMIMLTITQILLLTSCKNDGWELVSSITITTDGKTKTFKSQIVHGFGEPDFITEEEYEQASSNRKLSDYTLDIPSNGGKYKSFTEIEKISNGATQYSYQEENLKGDWYYYIYIYPNSLKKEYLKKPYIDTSYYLVYVKVVNDSTIKIKTDRGETTYTVTSYSIK